MHRTDRSRLSGVGLGARSPLLVDMLRSPETVDFVELTFEAHRTGARRAEAVAVAEVWPAAVHGVGLSLGCAEGIDDRRARDLGDFARATRAAWITEHAAFVRSDRRELGHLIGLPHRRDAARCIAANLARARRTWPDVPVAIENVAWTLRYPDDAMPEGAFYEDVVRRAGAPLLLDVANVYANARNAGVDPVALAATFPLEEVAMIHVAGGVQRGGFYFDTRGHDVADEVFALLAFVLRRTGPVPILLERDEHLPAFSSLRSELDHLREVSATDRGNQEASPPRARSAEGARPRLGETGGAQRRRVGATPLAAQQIAVASWLQHGDTPPGFDPRWGEITRDVLRKKRASDVRACLPRLARCEGFEDRLDAELSARPRGRGEDAVDEAARIANGLSADPRFAAAARRDAAAVRARFVRGAEGNTPRFAPFVERVQLDGGAAWLVKGLGREAPLRFIHARNEDL